MNAQPVIDCIVHNGARNRHLTGSHYVMPLADSPLLYWNSKSPKDGHIVPFPALTGTHEQNWIDLCSHLSSLYTRGDVKRSAETIPVEQYAASDGFVHMCDQFVASQASSGEYAVNVTIRDDHLIVTGDFHGSIHTMWRLLHLWGVQNGHVHKDMHLFFLGDLIDRGGYGLQCVTVVMLLSLLNPGRVHWIRGNHENDFDTHVTFWTQLKRKGFENNSVYDVLKHVFHVLPIAIRVTYGFIMNGNNTDQSVVLWLAHGGLPYMKTLPDSDKKAWRSLKHKDIIPLPAAMATQIMWNDVSEGPTQLNIRGTNENSVVRLYALSVADVAESLAFLGCDYCIRGHQDNYASFFVQENNSFHTPTHIDTLHAPAGQSQVLTTSNRTGYHGSLVNDAYALVRIAYI